MIIHFQRFTHHALCYDTILVYFIFLYLCTFLTSAVCSQFTPVHSKNRQTTFIVCNQLKRMQLSDIHCSQHIYQITGVRTVNVVEQLLSGHRNISPFHALYIVIMILTDLLIVNG